MGLAVGSGVGTCVGNGVGSGVGAGVGSADGVNDGAGIITVNGISSVSVGSKALVLPPPRNTNSSSEPFIEPSETEIW